MKKLFAIPLLTVMTISAIGQANMTALGEQPKKYLTMTQQFKKEERIRIRCKLTAYCCEKYFHICNDGNPSVTATGTKPTPGRTVAVDPKIIPYGSKVIINGHTYIAEDCGDAIKGNRVDILFPTHREALQFGIQYADVYVIKP